MSIRIQRLLLLCYTICLLSPAVPARAEVIGLEWRGVIDEYQPGFESWAGPVPLGTEMLISFAIETTNPNLCGGGGTSGLYQMAQPATLSILGNTYQSAGFIEVDAPEGACLSGPQTGVDFRFVSWAPTQIGNPDLANFPLYFLSALSGYYGATPGGIPTLPPHTPFPSSFHSRALSGEGEITVAVPEPATLMLLGTGLALAWSVRRRQSQRSV